MPVTPRILTCLLRSNSHMPSRLTRSATLACALGAGITTTAMAQLGERAIPGVYAITNARVVPVSAPAMEHATIVIRDGLITAVGPAVAAPADARIIDGAGLTIYPGLIDALSNLGVPAPRQQGGGGAAGFFAQQGPGGPSQQPPPSAPNSQHPAGLQPELRAIDIL